LKTEKLGTSQVEKKLQNYLAGSSLLEVPLNFMARSVAEFKTIEQFKNNLVIIIPIKVDRNNTYLNRYIHFVTYL
jgi:hypothetical protein